MLSYNKDLSQRCFEARKLCIPLPSYIVLSSISRAFEILEKKAKALSKVKQSIDIFKRKSQNRRGVH